MSGYVFGPRTQQVVMTSGLNASVHDVLWDVVETSVMSEWAKNVQARTGCSSELARALADAMTKDVLPSGPSEF